MPGEPKPYWEIKLAWSKYDQGKWTPKQISASPVVQKQGGQIVSTVVDPGYYRLKALLTDTGLSLSLWISIL
jgi:hypothetical protein